MARRYVNAELELRKRGDKRGLYRVASTSGKTYLDDYLMKKFGVDRSDAHEVSNQITRMNLPPDKSAKIEDFAGEEWADSVLSKPVDVAAGQVKPEPPKAEAAPPKQKKRFSSEAELLAYLDANPEAASWTEEDFEIVADETQPAEEVVAPVTEAPPLRPRRSLCPP